MPQEPCCKALKEDILNVPLGILHYYFLALYLYAKSVVILAHCTNAYAPSINPPLHPKVSPFDEQSVICWTERGTKNPNLKIEFIAFKASTAENA